MLSTLTEYSAERADFQLRPNVSSFGLFEYKKINQCIKIGYDAAIGNMPEILNALYFKKEPVILR
jgi:hypothetical protein